MAKIFQKLVRSSRFDIIFLKILEQNEQSEDFLIRVWWTLSKAEVIYKSLVLIFGIILHDIIYKMIKIFYFSRFKPSSLQFTIFQLLRWGLKLTLKTRSLIGLYVSSFDVIGS